RPGPRSVSSEPCARGCCRRPARSRGVRLLDNGLFFLHGGVLELLLTDPTRQDALRAQKHHPNQDDAVDDEVEPLSLLGKSWPIAAGGNDSAQTDVVRQ